MMEINDTNARLRVEIHHDSDDVSSLQGQVKDFIDGLVSDAEAQEALPTTVEGEEVKVSGYWGYSTEGNEDTWLIGYTPREAEDSSYSYLDIINTNKGKKRIENSEEIIKEYISGFVSEVTRFIGTLKEYNLQAVSIDFDFYIENLDESKTIASLVGQGEQEQEFGRFYRANYAALYKDTVEISVYYDIVRNNEDDSRKALKASLLLEVRKPGGYRVLNELLGENNSNITDIARSIVDKTGESGGSHAS